MTWNFKPEDYEKEDNFDRLNKVISDLRAEVKRLERYEELVHFIYNDYTELSHHKIESQNRYWRKLCFKLINEDHPLSEALKIETPLKDNF